MNRKTLVRLLIIVFAAMAIFALLRDQETRTLPEELAHEDGTYRGIFADGPDIQVNVEFKLEDGIVKETRFRHLYRDENYFLSSDEEPYSSVINQYREALAHLEGKGLETLKELYEPQNIVSTEVDGYTSATIRSSKIISAVRDALNRGVYSY